MPQVKTAILRNTNTNFKLLESYLLQLQTSYLLEMQPETKRYSTTKEGQKYITAWIKIKTMLYPQQAPIITKTGKSTKHNGPLITISVNHDCLIY